MKSSAIATVCLIIALAIGISHPASAHVLIRDDTEKVGAVLHIIPDDDPVAGETSQLFFDIQVQKLEKNKSRLSITDETTNDSVTVPFTVEERTITAQYIFPMQGTYRISLVAASSDKNTYSFEYVQRVSRGKAASITDEAYHPAAVAALLCSSVSFVALLIVMFNRRKQIKRSSRL